MAQIRVHREKRGNSWIWVVLAVVVVLVAAVLLLGWAGYIQLPWLGSINPDVAPPHAELALNTMGGLHGQGS
jgi:hypothetical protein